MLGEACERLQERGIDLTLTDAARAALVQEGYDPTYGARPLRRVIQRRVENAISKRVLAGEFSEGDTVLVDHGPDGLTSVLTTLAAAAQWLPARASARQPTVAPCPAVHPLSPATAPPPLRNTSQTRPARR
jgi:ATP-dependent Clp protease ATP-binding subunit ClpB